MAEEQKDTATNEPNVQTADATDKEAPKPVQAPGNGTTGLEREKHYLSGGQVFGPGRGQPIEELAKQRAARGQGGETGEVTRTATIDPRMAAGQPVSQPSQPGPGVPSGLVDSRPVQTDGTLGKGSIQDQDEDADDEDDSDEEESEYAGWSKDELEKEAADRGLTVARADGRTDRDPKVSDYVAALEEDDAENEDEE